MISRARAGACVCRVDRALYCAAFSSIHEVGSLPRQRPTAAQMIDFRIADPGANSRFASSLSRHLRINYSSLQASNSPMISRAWAYAYMCWEWVGLAAGTAGLQRLLLV